MKFFIFSGKVKDLRNYLKEWSQEEKYSKLNKAG